MVRGSVVVTWSPLVWLVLGVLGCDANSAADARPEPEPEASKAEAPAKGAEERAEVDTEGLLIGEFRLAEKPIVDGDTIRVEGVDRSIRLLGIDTEELFHANRDRAAARKDFNAYLARKRGESRRPVKTGTPLGEEAKGFAEDFFAGPVSVRLERDDPRKLRGSYGRPLAYAFVQKDGRWTSYSVECVRAGMSPYYTKYGYSHRFHNELTRAEAEARRAKRGIWAPNAKGYGDYDKRKAWWNARADLMREFDREASGRDDYIDLSHGDAIDRLERALGERVTVLGTIDRIKRFKTLTRVTLSMSDKQHFPLIFFDREVFERSGVGRYRGEPILARGEVARYRKGNYETLQIVVERPSQLTLPELPPAD